MSRFSPTVTPQYQGPNLGQSIAQALLMRDQINHQRDLDAVNTGVGLHPIDPNAAPEHSPLSRLVGGIYSRITGHANGNDVEDANANMANHPPMIGTTPNANQPGTAMDETTFNGSTPAMSERLPGAFDPMMGGFTPSQGSMMRLPSGQTVDMRMTPIGQRMQSADLSRQLTEAQLGNYQSEAESRRATMAQQQQTLSGRIAALKRLPQYANATDDELRGVASDDAIFTKTLDPTPKAPVPGTPEWDRMKIREAQIGAQYGYHPPVRDNYTLGVVAGPDGTPHVSVLNTHTGQITDTGRGKPTTPRSTGISPITRDAISHLGAASSADGMLDQFGTTLSTRHTTGVLGNIGIGKVDPQMQRANQAGEQFVTIVAPILNHGRMTAQDIEQVRRTYIPQVGDTPEVLRQKSAARKQIISLLKASGNPDGGLTPNDQAPSHAVPATGGGLFDDIPAGHQ